MINLTIEELIDRLKSLDEVYLLEILDVSAEELVERCRDIIDDKVEQLMKQVDWEE